MSGHISYLLSSRPYIFSSGHFKFYNIAAYVVGGSLFVTLRHLLLSCLQPSKTNFTCAIVPKERHSKNHNRDITISYSHIAWVSIQIVSQSHIVGDFSHTTSQSHTVAIPFALVFEPCIIVVWSIHHEISCTYLSIPCQAFLLEVTRIEVSWVTLEVVPNISLIYVATVVLHLLVFA